MEGGGVECVVDSVVEIGGRVLSVGLLCRSDGLTQILSQQQVQPH